MKRLIFILFLLGFCLPLLAIPLPRLNIGVEMAENPSQVATTLEIVALITILSMAPAILVLTTSFVRIVVVFSFLRQALGTQQMPPNQVLIGLALFLTFFIMAPVWSQSYENGIAPYVNEELSLEDAYTQTIMPVRTFMFKQVREKDLALFVRAAKIERPRNRTEVPTYVLIPAYVISELKTAFQIGFMIYIPFLVIDFIVASVLMSMGMMMLPPIMISLPFKLLMFVLVDGWNLIIGSLLDTFR